MSYDVAVATFMFSCVALIVIYHIKKRIATDQEEDVNVNGESNNDAADPGTGARAGAVRRRRPPVRWTPRNTKAEQARQVERRHLILNSVILKKAVVRQCHDGDDENEYEHETQISIRFPHHKEVKVPSIRSFRGEEHDDDDDDDEEAPAPAPYPGGDTPPEQPSTPTTCSTAEGDENESKSETISRALSDNLRMASDYILQKLGASSSLDSDSDSDSDSDLENKGREKSSSSLYSPKTCAICLEKYKDGDDICWSKNENCPHAYHVDCIVGWLMNNDDCPLCREKYLELEVPGEKKEEEEDDDNER